MADPPELCCPQCSGLIKNATQLPCCHTALCRACAYKKLMTNRKRCWLQKGEACNRSIQLDQLSPAVKMRKWIDDYRNGGTLYKDEMEKEGTADAEEAEYIPEYIDAGDRLPHVPLVVVKQEAAEEEEYCEMGMPDLSRVKSEAAQPSFFTQETRQVKGLPAPGLKQELSEEEEDLATAQPYTLPNTPSSVRTDFQSSGYWSDDAMGRPLFGKLQWNPEDLTQGHIECWEEEEVRRVHVSRYEVRCGAESGDLVEFTLGNDAIHGKVATRVKLVEKALPASEEDQIRSQETLKRSLEISAGIFESAQKKVKLEAEGDVYIPDLSGSSYHDIAADEEEHQEHSYEDWGQLLQSKVKSELSLLEEQVISTECVCNTPVLSRCGQCPVYYLRSEEKNVILEGESVTFVARIEGNHGPVHQELHCVRHLPYPFPLHSGGKEMKLLNTLGPDCIVKKISPVFKENYVFVSLVNNLEYQVNICAGDLVGICQLHHVKDFEISGQLVMEPPDRQAASNLPVFVKPSDISLYEENTLCGFGEIGATDTNYKHCLVRVVLRPEYRHLLELVKCDMTVQVRRNVWLELVPRRGSSGGSAWKRLLPKTGGIIATANCIMNEAYIDTLLSRPPPHAMVTTEKAAVGRAEETQQSVPQKDEDGAADAYATMMMKIDMDISSSGVSREARRPGGRDLLLSRTFKGLVVEEKVDLEPGDEAELNLFVVDDTEGGGAEFPVRNLLRLRMEVTANEDFRYFNNCYQIEPQVCIVRPSICRVAKGTRPSVRVRLRNPRNERVTLFRDSPVALVKLHVEDKKVKSVQPVRPAMSTPETSAATAQLPPPTTSPVSRSRTPDVPRRLERAQKRCLRVWDHIISEDVYGKSLRVEARYPYLTASSASQRPKIPFGIKDGCELTMRVGPNQDSRPVKVLEKVSGVYTCTICDAIILDKYNLQDHMYSAKHRDSMKEVQVIAGPEERLAMNRPLIQEQLDRIQPPGDPQQLPLLGLESLFEVLEPGGGTLPPLYHCALCTSSHDLRAVMDHLLSVEHNLKFLREYFPVAWSRFAGAPQPRDWTEGDLASYEAILAKIEAVHGRKKPSVVANHAKLEEAVDKMSVNQYTSRRAELEAFFKGLGPRPDPSTSDYLRSLYISRPGVTRHSVELPPLSRCTLLCQLMMPVTAATAARMEAKFVSVSRHPNGSAVPCDIVRGFSRITMDNQVPCIRVVAVNDKDVPVRIERNCELALVRWRR